MYRSFLESSGPRPSNDHRSVRNACGDEWNEEEKKERGERHAISERLVFRQTAGMAHDWHWH